MNATQAIEELGGLSATARVLGLRASTVQHWKKHNRIPAWRIEALERALKEKRRTKKKGRAA